MKKTRLTPESAWSQDHRSSIKRLIEISEEMSELRSERAAILASVPCGCYHSAKLGKRVMIAQNRISSLSVGKLKQYVSDHVLSICRSVRLSRRVTITDLPKETT